MPSQVHFASTKMKRLSGDESLPAKFRRMLREFDMAAMFKDKRVAIKMHVGGHLGYSTIHPLFIRDIVAAVKDGGGWPFITDGSFAIPGAVARGYTQEVLGAPLYPVAGAQDKYFYAKDINYRSLKQVEIAGNIADADAMIVLSHGKGHGQCGFGGAIKNLAMGAVTVRTRGWIHGIMETEFSWNAEACTHCHVCAENCPAGALKFTDEDHLRISSHDCRYCMHCVDSCPAEAITITPASTLYFQEAMARTTKAVLDTFEPNRVLYITVLLAITPICDCWGFTTPSLVPDIGIMSSTDIVAIEQAAIDAIDAKNYIPGSLPEQLTLTEGDGHLLQRIWGKDPYLQVQTAATLGLGSRDYTLEEIA